MAAPPAPSPPEGKGHPLQPIAPSFFFPSSLFPVTLHPSVQGKHDGRPACTVSAPEFDESASLFKHSLVARCEPRPPPLSQVAAAIRRRWGLRYSVAVSSLDPTHLLLRFVDGEDLAIAWSSPFRRIASCRLLLFRWAMDFSMNRDPKTSAVWVRLPGLPLPFQNPTFLQRIGSSLGYFLCPDLRTQAFGLPFVPRICVEMDVSVPFPEYVWLEVEGEYRFRQPLFFESAISYCSNCLCQGHSTSACAWERQNDSQRKITKACAPTEEEASVSVPERDQATGSTYAKAGEVLSTDQAGRPQLGKNAEGAVQSVIDQAQVPTQDPCVDAQSPTQDPCVDKSGGAANPVASVTTDGGGTGVNPAASACNSLDGTGPRMSGGHRVIYAPPPFPLPPLTTRNQFVVLEEVGAGSEGSPAVDGLNIEVPARDIPLRKDLGRRGDTPVIHPARATGCADQPVSDVSQEGVCSQDRLQHCDASPSAREGQATGIPAVDAGMETQTCVVSDTTCEILQSQLNPGAVAFTPGKSVLEIDKTVSNPVISQELPHADENRQTRTLPPSFHNFDRNAMSDLEGGDSWNCVYGHVPKSYEEEEDFSPDEEINPLNIFLEDCDAEVEWEMQRRARKKKQKKVAAVSRRPRDRVQTRSSSRKLLGDLGVTVSKPSDEMTRRAYDSS